MTLPTVARIEPLADFDSCRDEWRELAERSGNVFSTWDWARAWWGVFGAGRLLLAALRGGDGSPTAVLPLYLSRRRPLGLARLVGHGPADQLGPVCSPADAGVAYRALPAALDRLAPGWDVLVADRLPGDRPPDGLPGGAVVKREPSPALRIDGISWEDFLAARSANFRQQVRRRERRLLRGHDVRYRLSERSDELDADLDALFELHGRRWGGRSAAFDAKRRAFHREFAAAALEQGWLRLWLAEVDGRPVAAWYGFRFAGVESYYQAGRDPAWDREAIGFVLLAHTVREACADGMREYRLLLGSEPYKLRFADHDDELVTVGVGGTPAGRAAVGAARAADRLRPAVRRLRRALRHG